MLHFRGKINLAWLETIFYLYLLDVIQGLDITKLAPSVIHNEL
jgi:hypothetical protein